MKVINDENYDLRKLRPTKFSLVRYNVAHQQKGVSWRKKNKDGLSQEKLWFSYHSIRNPQIYSSSLPNVGLSVAFRNFYPSHFTEVKYTGNFTSTLHILSLSSKKSLFWKKETVTTLNGFKINVWVWFLTNVSHNIPTIFSGSLLCLISWINYLMH